MSNWNRVNTQIPCEICGKPDWCSVSTDGELSICRRVDTGAGQTKRDRSGAEYYLYRRHAQAVTRVTVAKQMPKLDLAQIDLIYRELLKQLPLELADVKGLHARGLNQAVIAQNQYATLPREERVEIAKAVVDRFGRRAVLATPGFIKQDELITLAGPVGLLIPVRNCENQIVALKSRRRAGDKSRYVYFSSAAYGGAGPGAPVHVPLFAREKLHCVRLTEGELKADVAVALDRTPTISVAGVSGWRAALAVLKNLRAPVCRLSFDMDALTNPFVASSLRAAATELVREGFDLEFETWDPKFKGIDDALAKGAHIEVLRAEEAWDAIGQTG